MNDFVQELETFALLWIHRRNRIMRSKLVWLLSMLLLLIYWTLLIVLFIQVLAQLTPCYTVRLGSELEFSPANDIHIQAALRRREPDIWSILLWKYIGSLIRNFIGSFPQIIYDFYLLHHGKHTNTHSDTGKYILAVYLRCKWLWISVLMVSFILLCDLVCWIKWN